MDFLLHFRQKCGVNIKDELSAAANLMENIFKQLESTNPKVAVEERTKIAQYLSKFIKGGDVASKQITTKMSLWGKELVDESGEKKHIGVQVLNIAFDPIKIYTCYASQNDCQHLSFVKYFNVVSKKDDQK